VAAFVLAGPNRQRDRPADRPSPGSKPQCILPLFTKLGAGGRGPFHRAAMGERWIDARCAADEIRVAQAKRTWETSGAGPHFARVFSSANASGKMTCYTTFVEWRSRVYPTGSHWFRLATT
ncbi:MAG: hypothetical protein AAFV29_22255, partial [Myxococcota bacterium]